MGRTQPTLVMPPNSVRRVDRARKAKDTINKVIPELLRSSPRARHGVHQALLVKDPVYVPAESSHTSDTTLRIRIQDTDTLTAARRLTQTSRRASMGAKSDPKPKKIPNVCVLSMASPLRPGGGFTDGATSQEEFLCMRTTLYPSLWDDFYRLPEIGGVVTADVLVFRDSTPDAEDLGKRDRFFVDVITSAMIRFPETNTQRETEEKGGCTCGVSYCDRDRDLVTRKMRAVLRMAQNQGAERLVLGAWGCGAYGNPVKEVAKIWKRVLCGTARKPESWTGIKEIVFAITDRNTAKEFEKCFSDVLTPTTETASPPSEAFPLERVPTNPEKEVSDQVDELVTKIQETEMQLDQVRNPRSKARLREVLDDLNKKLSQVGATPNSDDDEPLNDDLDTSDIDLEGVQNSDPEDVSYYHFDEDDVASSGSVSPASMFDFRFPGSKMSSSVEDSPDTTASSLDHETFEKSEIDGEGWFNGSINGLTALLGRKGSKVEASPVLGPDAMGTDIEELNLEGYLRRFSTQES